LRREQPDTDASRAGINRILCNGGSELPSIVTREFGLQTPRHPETAAQIGVEKIPEARIASSGANLARVHTRG